MPYRVLFGPWTVDHSAAIGFHDSHATRMEQMLGLEKGCHVTLSEDWQRIVKPQYMADFLAAKGATVSYTSDEVMRLPDHG